MILTAIGSIAQFVLLLAVMRVATTYLTPNEMGRLSLITAATAFYALFLVNPVGMFINRRFHSWNKTGKAKYYLKLHWLYLLFVSVLASLSLWILNDSGIFRSDLDLIWLIMLVGGSLFFNTINQTAIPSLNLLEYRKQFVALSLATILVGLCVAFLLVEYASASAENWLLGLLVGQALLAVIGVWTLFEKLNLNTAAPVITGSHLYVLFSFAWPVAISVALNWVQTQGYRFVIADSLGLESLGLFVVGYGISAGLIAAFESVLTTYFQPKFYKRVCTDDLSDQSEAWNRYAGAILPSLCLVICLLVALAPELTRLMVSSTYLASSEYVIWGALAEGSRVISSVYSLSAHAKMKTKLLLLPNLAGALVCIALTWILVPKFGVHGVGLTRSIAGIGMIVVMHYLMSINLRLELPHLLVLRGLLLGAALFIISAALRFLLGNTSESYLLSFLLAGSASLVFLGMFYWLIYPFLLKHE